MFSDPFQPVSPTLLANLTSASTGGISPSTAGSMQAVRLVNLSTGPNAFVMFSTSPTATPTLPLSSIGSTASVGFFLPQNKPETFKCGPNTYITAITTAATLVAQLSMVMGNGKI